MRDETKDTERVEKGTLLTEYQVIVEREVQRKKDREAQKEHLRECQVEAFKLINEITLLWPLVFGSVPEQSQKTIRPQNAPNKWSSNARDLLEELHPRPFSIELTIDEHKWVILPYHPLERLNQALGAYRLASTSTRTLVKLHYDALDSNPRATMFLFAKGLELVRAILPGNTDKERAQALPLETREALTRDLAWLFMIANQRLDVRHVVKNPSDLTLHPEATDEERGEFIAGASTVMKSVAEQQLGLRVAVSNGRRYEIAEFRSV